MYTPFRHLIYVSPLLSNGVPIQSIQPFIESSIIYFMNEMDLYLNNHSDRGFLTYFHERSFLSMFFNGVIRNDEMKKVTCVQEYPVNIDPGKRDKRCDAWVNYDQNIFLIEAKRDKLGNGVLPEDHWDMDAWFKWDQGSIRERQLLKYHKGEEESLKFPCIKSCYLMTLVFKIIRQNFQDHFNEAKRNLDVNYHPGRDWFYSVGFVCENGTELLTGVEVYGTIEKVYQITI